MNGSEASLFPPGFLDTRADILIDIVTLSFIVILPVLIWSWRSARVRKNYVLHRNIQLTLAATLFVVVGIFEYDLHQSGGIFEMTKDSSYADTTLLLATIYIHGLFSISATLIWVLLILVSLRRFGNPPSPGSFSSLHRAWGIAGMVTMMGAGLTAPPLYYFGFVA